MTQPIALLEGPNGTEWFKHEGFMAEVKKTGEQPPTWSWYIYDTLGPANVASTPSHPIVIMSTSAVRPPAPRYSALSSARGQAATREKAIEAMLAVVATAVFLINPET